ncbi:hypothetical protein CK203_036925 [Vitis vinifera]|uniref:Reverse transcriptase zinc-binding domain-containing protein n=1 Tax=Vitis vinifera TaxID=29760 RepID=A0A438IUR8_VITVI|nr:hypothetical protein CK203_036925 [Vitis vinifera]
MPQLLAALLPSKQWLKSTFWLQHFLSFASPPKPVFLFQSTSSGFRFNSYAANRRLSTIPVRLDQPEDGSSDLDKLRVLRQKIEVSGITLDDSCVPGRYHHLICPKILDFGTSDHMTRLSSFFLINTAYSGPTDYIEANGDVEKYMANALDSRSAVQFPKSIIWSPCALVFLLKWDFLLEKLLGYGVSLGKRGWPLANRCFLCCVKEESIDHILIHCTKLMERSLSLHITQDRNFAMWRCFRSTCGWAGRVFPESSAAYSEVTNNWMTVDSLGLEPLGDKVLNLTSFQLHIVMVFLGTGNCIGAKPS